MTSTSQYNAKTSEMVYTIRCLYDEFIDSPDVINKDLFAENFSWHQAESSPVFEGSPVVGLQDFLAKVHWSQPEWEQCGFRIDEVLAGDKIVMQGYYTGLYKPTGKVLCAQMLHIWTVVDGKITSLQELNDTQHFHTVMSA